MKNDILFFVKNPSHSSCQFRNDNFSFVIWYPKSLYKPKGILFVKYIVWFFFHIFHIFNSKLFSINLLYLDGKLVHHTFIFPSFYRFPFMGVDDLQFGDIWTSDDFKNLGIASSSLKYLLEIYSRKKIWFLCDKSNEASVKLAIKCGFELVGTGTKKSRFLNIFSQYIPLKKI